MSYELWIPGVLPRMNELMLSRGARIWKKKKSVAFIALLCSQARIPQLKRASVAFHIIAPNMRADPDGMVAGTMKVVLDALQHAGVLSNDGWKQVAALGPFTWSVDKSNPGTRVTITPVDI